VYELGTIFIAAIHVFHSSCLFFLSPAARLFYIADVESPKCELQVRAFTPSALVVGIAGATCATMADSVVVWADASLGFLETATSLAGFIKPEAFFYTFLGMLLNVLCVWIMKALRFLMQNLGPQLSILSLSATVTSPSVAPAVVAQPVQAGARADVIYICKSTIATANKGAADQDEVLYYHVNPDCGSLYSKKHRVFHMCPRVKCKHYL